MENKERIRSLAENVWAYIAAFLRWGVLGLSLIHISEPTRH